MAAIALNWNLDTTADSALRLARGILHAANNDNVQPFAIAACERFGNTVAMSAETCNKIESLTAKTPASAMIVFLQVYVGFSEMDSATQLSKSQAGVQFLGLAAALVSSTGAVDGGNALHRMLMSSASDKTLLPTTRQLVDLLQILQPRLAQSGFMNAVAGWHIYLSQLPALSTELADYLPMERLYPNAEGIDSLVDAFRKLSRVGDADIVRISIEVKSSLASWVVAFTKWCLGLPPSVYLTERKLVHEQPGSQVDVVIVQGDVNKLDLRVIIHHTIGTPSELIEVSSHPQNQKRWAGMVNLREYSRLTLLEFGFTNDLAIRTLLQVLPLALGQILHRLWVVSDGVLSKKFSNSQQQRLYLSPFPKEHIITETMCQYLGSSEGPKSENLRVQYVKDVRLSDHPAIKLYTEAIQKECLCDKCRPEMGNEQMCGRSRFWQNLAFICADILVLSLFGGHTYPLLCLERQQPVWGSRFPNNIEIVLVKEKGADVVLSDVLRYVWELTGQNVPTNREEWIMSSSKGQVVYLQFFETLSYKKEGYLALNCLPGLLRHNGEVYSGVISKHSFQPQSNLTQLPIDQSIAVTKPITLVRDARLTWMVTAHDRVLHATLALNGGQYSLHKVIRNLADALMVESCAHSPEAALPAPDKLCTFTSPANPRLAAPKVSNPRPPNSQSGVTHPSDSTAAGATGGDDDDQSMISVVAVDGNNEFRLLTLTYDGPFVLRGESCLACCLDVCRKAKYPAVIL